MRMGLGLLIGILIMLWGLGIIINVVFHINIPIFKILFGLFLIYIGLKIVFGNSFPCSIVHLHSRDAVFSHKTYHGLHGESNEYNAIFGKAMVDLRGVELKEKVTRIKVAVVLGNAEVILDKNMPVRIKVDTVLGEVKLPQNIAGSFGSAYYQSQDFDDNKNYLLIDASSIIGGIDIHY
jgi:predicted membrane protein